MPFKFVNFRSKTRLYRLTFSQTINVRLFQPKEFADDNFKFDEDGKKIPS